jgi:hypothetical protein
LGELLGDLLGVIFGEGVRQALLGRRANRQARNNSVECSMRATDGDEAALPREWRQGLAILSPGQMVFSSNGPTRTIVVTAVEVDHPRELTRKEKVRRGSVVIGLRTATAELEWAVPEDRLGWALSKLGSETLPA